ncbi:11388_t:CDS:2, partial [Dentiscutata erythropus]
VIILSTDIGLDIIFAFIILSKEVSNRYFREWIANNFKFAAIFTLLASADIEILLVLSSHFAGLNIFTAAYSNEAKNYIFWSKILTIIINDLPWLIVQVFYYLNKIIYKTIPLLALIISFISIGTTILLKAYMFIYKCHYKRNNRILDKNLDFEENIELCYANKKELTNEISLYTNEDNDLKEAMLKENRTE